MGNHKIGIRRSNVEKILLGAEKVFAEKGFGGTAMADIAEEVQLPRSNLHYYFSTKSELYSAVLLDLLEVWKQDALCFEMFDDPRVVLSSYIRAKMNHSRTRPHGSKVWANEIIHGAPTLGETLDLSLYDWAKMKEAKIRQWVEDGRILPVEPSSLLYMIWASTQHYADFNHQVTILNDHQPLSDLQFEKAVQTVTQVILRGIGLEP
ncbi:TetR/AcrR family transcriptional regulator [Pseudomonas gingeri]|uniref:TetR/AcrR family transcriptional regulator n=1 Tax=Pseudomonas gingeri TaxID=117681 RepID=UPI0015A47949|nr:TetR/AcrR family transcriptional regulator [Pseudomonas gingeri]NVZ99390.1 TetR/AcrR family transcriptional regulator [Pseudomonas gingeri]NWA13435.1 TetR/AcrR family transcriptional regulator [Pseudomonas gingeri]NWA55696.1 TetR/AcrR family transcriptional regulator [Pseudomonas gingeri]NWA95450.1 TetR/AcrR family transcriptional regulator [Pseudomonas gingeri]NWB00537.1 TetR/AcrR family transcriptional regulator [Pseudomonas gingeri]